MTQIREIELASQREKRQANSLCRIQGHRMDSQKERTPTPTLPTIEEKLTKIPSPRPVQNRKRND